MREHKNDSICKECANVHAYNPHKCNYIVSYGTVWKSPVNGRVGLSKDGCSCKYFYPKKSKL